jgi:hypothetical protein
VEKERGSFFFSLEETVRRGLWVAGKEVRGEMFPRHEQKDMKQEGREVSAMIQWECARQNKTEDRLAIHRAV